jgi:hypothetical protein
MEKVNSIALTSVATGGKDTCFKLLNKILSKKNKILDRQAFADILKLEINNFVKNELGISAFTNDPIQKEIIRPIMIGFGQAKRRLTSGEYWIKELEPKVLDSIKNGNIPCITDLRFPNEAKWFKEKIGGTIIHITRFDINNNKIGPTGNDEAEFDPIMYNLSDYKLTWTTSSNYELLESIVCEQLKTLIDRFK